MRSTQQMVLGFGSVFLVWGFRWQIFGSRFRCDLDWIGLDWRSLRFGGLEVRRSGLDFVVFSGVENLDGVEKIRVISEIVQ